MASQKKKFVWNVVPSDPERATAEEEDRTVIIRRFEAVTAAEPITLTEGPADGAEFHLDYGSRDEVLATAAWECNARNVTYALEYSLDAEMNAPKMPSADDRKIRGDDPRAAGRAALGSGRRLHPLTRTIYWRITSTVNIKTTPSEIRSLRLTGMLRPYTDLRDPENPEVYEVVKIGEDFWMAENLRAMKYSDGTAFTTVDEIYGNPAAKSYTDETDCRSEDPRRLLQLARRPCGPYDEATEGRRYPDAGRMPRRMARIDDAGVAGLADGSGQRRLPDQVGTVLDREHRHERTRIEHRSGGQVLARQCRSSGQCRGQGKLLDHDQGRRHDGTDVRGIRLEQRDRTVEL